MSTQFSYSLDKDLDFKTPLEQAQTLKQALSFLMMFAFMESNTTSRNKH